MDFARKQLEKYGWKEGEGIGKEGNKGLVSAIKPKCKSGKEGMGFRIAKELVDPWWSKAYNDSLNRINVNEAADETKEAIVSFDNNTSEEDGIRPMEKMRKRHLQANFVEFSKGATLKNGVQEDTSDDDSSSSDSEPETKKKSRELTDEELFKACGGRTAHKSARFGLQLNGKLARIAAQEEKLLASIKSCSTSKSEPGTAQH